MSGISDRPSATERDDAAVALARLLRRQLDGSVSASADVEGRARLVGAVSAANDRRRGATMRALAWLASLGAIAAVSALVFAPRAALTYEARDLARAGGPDGELVARADGDAGAVRFSDGSRVTLAARGRARVAHTSWRGAEIALDEGRADVEVTHRRLGRWVIAAGPYRVRVMGTRFSIAWSPASRRFEVAMQAGTVMVEGPGVRGELALREGDRLIANDARVTVGRVPDVAAAPDLSRSVPPTLPAREDPAAPEGPPPARATRSVQPSPRRQGVSWADRVAAGDFEPVVREADRRLDDVLRGAPLAELNALADAARYTGRHELARRALTSERRRFPATATASMAAFLLGRLADDRGDADEAVRWYERYLAETPNGAFAAEALGRQMLASKRDRARAGALAQQYLRRFPQGPYAAAAKSFVAER